jgi:hypothetical protein
MVFISACKVELAISSFMKFDCRWPFYSEYDFFSFVQIVHLASLTLRTKYHTFDLTV